MCYFPASFILISLFMVFLPLQVSFVLWIFFLPSVSRLILKVAIHFVPSPIKLMPWSSLVNCKLCMCVRVCCACKCACAGACVWHVDARGMWMRVHVWCVQCKFVYIKISRRKSSSKSSCESHSTIYVALLLLSIMLIGWIDDFIYCCIKNAHSMFCCISLVVIGYSCIFQHSFV